MGFASSVFEYDLRVGVAIQNCESDLKNGFANWSFEMEVGSGVVS